MIGRTISHYRIVEKLGEGGMGVVYIAEDTVLGRRVAIKTLTARGGDNQHFRTRFLREARAVSALSHPHIAHIYDYGETEDDEPYIVMELIKGTTLGDLMAKEALTIPRAIEIVKQVAEALGEAHRNGIVHRDIKPSNVAINDRGNVKVLDFGLAKQLELGSVNESDPERQTLLNTQTREGVIVGTPMYLSPEQALGVDVDARSDLFALGGLLYECIAGKPAFSGGSPVEICAQIIREDPPPPSSLNSSVTREMDRIVLKALAKKPNERYQSADEMIADLRAVEDSVSRGSDRTVTRLISSTPGTQPTGALATLSDIFKRPRLSVGYVAAGLLLLGLFVVAYLYATRATLPLASPEAQRLYELGVAALHEGTYYKASKHLERAVAVDPKFALAHARLAEAYVELDYPDKAKDELLRANQLVTDKSVFDRENRLFFEGISATVTRDLAGAIKAYQEVARLRAKDSDALVDLGRAYENNYETDKALNSYQQATQLNASNPAALVRQAVLYGRIQDLPKATAAFDRVDGLFNDAQNFEGRAEVAYQRGFLFGQMNRVQEARSQAESSFEIAKIANNAHQQVRALLLLGSVAGSSGDTAKAQQLVTQAIELARANDMENLATQGLLDLGNALLIRRTFDEAERYLYQGLELAQRHKEKRNEARANLLLGWTYIQQELPDKGAPFIDQAAAFYRDRNYRREMSRCMMMSGRVQLLKGDYEGATRTLDEQLQLAKQVEDPGQIALSQSEVAAALSKQDLYPQALIRFTESYELNQSLKNPLRAAFALLNKGDMLARLGRYAEARAALDELKTYLDPLSEDNNYKHLWTIWSYLIRAQMAFSEQNYTATKSECQTALRIITPQNTKLLGSSEAEVKGLLGLAEVHLGETKTGLKLCEEAVAISSRDAGLKQSAAGLRLTLAEALMKVGDAKRAQVAAGEAQPLLAAEHRREPEWRAWVVLVWAGRRLNDSTAEQEQLGRARAILQGLRSQWGEEAFKTYSSRKEIAAYLEQIE